MKKSRSVFICQSCSYASPRWLGKCPECGQWNTFLEERQDTQKKGRPGGDGPAARPVPLSRISVSPEPRLKTGLSEVDRVLGGGIVQGSVVLFGGAPGIGKSTLLLQVGEKIAEQGKKVLYISGEESAHQIKMRAERLSVRSDNFFLLAETNVETIVRALEEEKPGLAVVDSIQTIYTPGLESLPGNVSQVRSCGAELTRAAKTSQIPVFFVGHMTKEGTIAGPRVLEHMVDCLILLEGDEQHLYRLLRSVKNRFGSTNEVGIFEMTDRGILEVKHPSEFLLSQRRDEASGTVVTVSLEGTRPLLVEVQALVATTSYGVPQRTATGIDHRRLSLLLAVLEKRAGLRFGTQDVFVNVAGGLRLTEPGVDMAVSMALVSSIRDTAVDGKTAFVGEVGLTGEIRGISHMAQRIAEAERMGFRTVYVPFRGMKNLKKYRDIHVTGVETVRELVQKVFPASGKKHS